jgi:hypothetical protein
MLLVTFELGEELLELPAGPGSRAWTSPGLSGGGPGPLSAHGRAARRRPVHPLPRQEDRHHRDRPASSSICITI